jgi:hypothetical protein
VDAHDELITGALCLCADCLPGPIELLKQFRIDRRGER